MKDEEARGRKQKGCQEHDGYIKEKEHEIMSGKGWKKRKRY